MNGSASVLAAGVAVVLSVRVASTAATARSATGGWPVYRCGRAAAAVLVYDLAVTTTALVALAWLPTQLLAGPAGQSAAAWAAAIGSVCAGAVAAAAVRWRPGQWSLPWTSTPARREDRLGRRGRLLLDLERHAARSVSRWIAHQSDDCRRRAGTTPELLLPAVWPAVRLLLRETDDRGRTGLALLMAQAQAVMDDAAPAQERLLTLLQLVHDRTGPAGVRRVLEQAGLAPVRHGRTGAPAWGVGPAALPSYALPGQRSVSIPSGPPVPTRLP